LDSDKVFAPGWEYKRIKIATPKGTVSVPGLILHRIQFGYRFSDTVFKGQFGL
jgi:hypothetical protein